MKYQNLHALVRGSSSARRYFLSLPVEIQIAMQEHSAYIHTAAELHQRAESVIETRRKAALVGWQTPFE